MAIESTVWWTQLTKNAIESTDLKQIWTQTQKEAIESTIWWTQLIKIAFWYTNRWTQFQKKAFESTRLPEGLPAGSHLIPKLAYNTKQILAILSLLHSIRNFLELLDCDPLAPCGDLFKTSDHLAASLS